MSLHYLKKPPYAPAFPWDSPEQVICCETLRSVFKIEADITCDASHHCPYFIPMKILPDSSLDSVGESLSDT
mgnify:FL=1